MTLREKTVQFGIVSGGFDFQVDDNGSKTELTLSAFEGQSYPVVFTLEGNIRVTDAEITYLVGQLESFTRTFDKKVAGLLGSFCSDKRSQNVTGTGPEKMYKSTKNSEPV